MCVIADDNGAIGLGGVMGGESTSVSETTVNVFIESAIFDPCAPAAPGAFSASIPTRAIASSVASIPNSSAGLDLATKACHRVLRRRTSDITVAGRVPTQKRELAFDATLIEKLTGLKLHEAEAFGILAKLGFNIVVGRRVTIPSWRPDIHGVTDLVERWCASPVSIACPRRRCRACTACRCRC